MVLVVKFQILVRTVGLPISHFVTRDLNCFCCVSGPVRLINIVMIIIIIIIIIRPIIRPIIMPIIIIF